MYRLWDPESVCYRSVRDARRGGSFTSSRSNLYTHWYRRLPSSELDKRTRRRRRLNASYSHRSPNDNRLTDARDIRTLTAGGVTTDGRGRRGPLPAGPLARPARAPRRPPPSADCDWREDIHFRGGQRSLSGERRSESIHVTSHRTLRTGEKEVSYREIARLHSDNSLPHVGR